MDQSCHFPTTVRRGVDNSCYSSILILDHETITTSWAQDPQSLKSLIQDAWAVLLRCYVRNDIVSFLALSNPSDRCDSRSTSVRPCFGEGSEALVVQYQLINHLILRDIHVSGFKVVAGHGLRDLRVNTAVRFTTSCCKDLLKKDCQRPPSTSDEETYIDNLDMILNVGNALTDISISYRYPMIREQYAISVSDTFRNIVRQMTFESELRLYQLDNVSEQDKQRMLAWNPESPFGSKQESCMHHLVAAKAREVPDSNAVCAWDGSLTYSELEAITSIAAKRLTSLGVGPGVYVPFAYEKSMWAVVATLAILKAGGAFVPLNPRDPPARLAEILSNVNACVVVTEEASVATFSNLVKHITIISADTVNQRSTNGELSIGGQSNILNSPQLQAVSPHDPIFVLFTSGSTGKAKGIIHEHAAICTHAMTHGDAMGYQGARVLQFAAHTFDVAIIDFFTTLLYGGCICIPSEEDRRNNIVEVINSMRADYSILTPSFAGLLEPSEVPTLKTLAIGGEALPQDRIERWAAKVRLIQIYGPAEVGICLTKEMTPNTAPEDVGRPLPNCSCWLVDPNDADQLIPIGATGELIIAGPSLASGYLNHETKTRLSFIDAPAWAVRIGLQFTRFYKTGDLLRYDVDSFDGSLCFVGRKDAQIKLRGQRIEPGEVEYHLGRLPNVEVSMITRPEEGCFAGELVAVVQMQRINGERSRVREEPVFLASTQPLSVEMVRKALSKVLPSYMIPTVCLAISSMPFVPSLKIDRRQISTWLTTLDSRPSESFLTALIRLTPGEATANALSVKIAGLLAPRDKTRRLGMEGHDFGIQEVGMDSIQIISLSMSLQKQYRIKVPMHILLSHKTTIRGLAELIDGTDTSFLDGRNSNHRQDLSVTNPSFLRIIDLCRESAELTSDLFRTIEAHNPNQTEGAKGTIKNVFITGATGYLGSAILQQLMETLNIHVYALVRCEMENIGLQRIMEAATSSGWWQDQYASRIHVWQGDLTKTSLGLGKTELGLLHGKIPSRELCMHAIIHNGARVHYSSDYETLKAVNVSSTVELLKIVASAPHVSTFVFLSGGEKPNIDTSEAAPAYLDYPSQASGYTQTKFVSEHIVQNCVDYAFFQKKRLRTVKPGYIIGSSRNGIANQSDFIWRLIAGCLDIAAYNREEAGNWLFIADVERVARSVVLGVFGPDDEPGKNSVDRVLDGLRFSELWEILEGIYDRTFEALGQEEWMNRLRDEVVKSGEEHLLFPLLHVLEKDGGSLGEKALLMKATVRTKEAVEKNVRYLIDVGFLPMPDKKGEEEYGRTNALRGQFS